MPIKRSPDDGGHRHHLRREMGLATATILVIASMIGTGIFTTSGLIMEALQDPQAMLLCWVVGGLFALTGALCYGELGAMFPGAGGDYLFLREGFGRQMGFLSGWISLIVGFSAPIAAASMASGIYFFRGLPAVFIEEPHLPILQIGIVSISPITIFAVSMILLFTLAHTHSLYLGSLIQNLLTLFKIAVILIFVAAGWGSSHGSMDHFTSGQGLSSILTGNFAHSLIFISFAYSGWSAAAYLGGEIKNPSRNIPLALLMGTLVVMVLYLLMNMVFIYALSAEEMSGVIEVGAKSALTLFGVRAGKIFSVAVTLCLLSMISAMIMSGPRVYYAMAADGSFFQWFGKVTPERGTPGPSILLQAFIAVIMVVTATFDKLLLYIGFTLSLFSMLTVIGMMRLRIKKPSLERPCLTFGYPVTPILFILGNLCIITFFIISNPVISLYGAGTILTGILAYVYFNRVYRKEKGITSKREG